MSTMSTPSDPSQPSRRIFTLASRASKLAQIQTTLVLTGLQRAHPSHAFSTVFMSTAGDKDKTQALAVLGAGGKALWTEELELALTQDRSVDILVHSLKDVPTVLNHPGCEIAAILEREDPLDGLVVKAGLGYKELKDLPDGSVVGTGSVRRVAQLRRAFPKLVFQDVRGNIDTRLAKLDSPTGPYTALILAKAGLLRMDLGHRITSSVGVPTLHHAVGQGALGLEIRSSDTEARALCRAIAHVPTELACFAERACLRVLEGGCSVPVGVSSTVTEKSEDTWSLKLAATVTALDGENHVEHTLDEFVHSTEEAEAVGEKLARVLIDTGAKDILDVVTAERAARQKSATAVRIEG